MYIAYHQNQPCELSYRTKSALKTGRGDKLVRDFHAEVLARRGLLRFLYLEAERALEGDERGLFCLGPSGIVGWDGVGLGWVMVRVYILFLLPLDSP